MPVIRDKQIIESSWQDWQEGETPSGDIIVTLDQWRSHKDALTRHDGRTGLRLASDQSPSNVAGDIENFDLIALEFPAFKDGRAYSYARLLRERYGFEGEIRAVGDVLRDQVFFMIRCGFDSFDIDDNTKVDSILAGLNEFTHVYQPASDRRNSVIAVRHLSQVAAE